MTRDRVLIVESDRLRRNLLGTYLQAAGFAVVEATSGEEAFSRLRSERGRIDRLVLGSLAPGLVCAAIVADEFERLHRGRAAVPAVDASPAEIGAALQRMAARPALAAERPAPQEAPLQALAA